jgi:hypothetical protein
LRRPKNATSFEAPPSVETPTDSPPFDFSPSSAEKLAALRSQTV